MSVLAFVEQHYGRVVGALASTAVALLAVASWLRRGIQEDE